MRNKKDIKWNKILILCLIGVVIGVINGFFGGGGGMICVPLLLFLGLEEKKAHATAVLTMLPISIASAIVYYSCNSVDLTIFLYIALGSLAGGIIGSFILKKIPNLLLQFIFAIIMIIAGVRICF